MESRISTYGLLILGAMIFSRYLISTNENSNDYHLSSVDSALNENLREDSYNLASTYRPTFDIETKLIASVLPDFDREYTPSNSDEIIDNSADESLLAINDVENSSIIDDQSNDGVVSMDQGSSSVVLMMPVTPQQTIIQKSDRGNYPLDGGNTISNTMNKLFPIKSED